MAKEEKVEFEGEVVEALPNAMFRVQLDNGHEVLGHVAGKMRRFRIRILPGDRVRVEVSPYDLNRARIEEHNRFEGMGPHLATARPIIDQAWTALAALGIEPRLEPIRGTTDGARLSALGLPTPNLSNGGHNFHSRTEWICVDDLARMSAVVVELIGLWGRAGMHGAPGR